MLISVRTGGRALLPQVQVYFREEIQLEALVRNLGGFTRFLDVTAAYCGEIVNFTTLGKEAGLPTRTVQSYFEVFEDTLIALRLPAGRKSPTKRLFSHPKMYLFDNGVTNALCHRLHSKVDPRLKGRLFEQFMVQETNRRLDYSGRDYALYYWRTNHGAEVECCIVCLAPEPISLDFVHIIPRRDYLAVLSRYSAESRAGVWGPSRTVRTAICFSTFARQAIPGKGNL